METNKFPHDGNAASCGSILDKDKDSSSWQPHGSVAPAGRHSRATFLLSPRVTQLEEGSHLSSVGARAEHQ